MVVLFVRKKKVLKKLSLDNRVACSMRLFLYCVFLNWGERTAKITATKKDESAKYHPVFHIMKNGIMLAG